MVALRAAGLVVYGCHQAQHVPPDADVVVHSLAVPPDNPEIQEAARRGITLMSYPAFLGQLFDQHTGIAVAGTHGKTSSAAMMIEVFVKADRDPTALIGGQLNSLGGNWRCGRGGEFIVEACEYRRSFLNFHPEHGLITNMERDHPEVYEDDGAVAAAFEAFLAGFRGSGMVVVNGDTRSESASHGGCGLEFPAELRSVTFGSGKDCDWRAEQISAGPAPCFVARYRGLEWGTVKLQVPGPHSIANALGVLALAVELGLPRAAVVDGLGEFTGVDRRFQRRGPYEGIDLVDDYAHHPTEVRSVIQAARDAFPSRRVWALFQPHQLGRLNAFGPEFATSLAGADEVGLLPAYSVRESEGDFPADLLDVLEQRLRERSVSVHRFDSLDDSATRLSGLLERGDVCLVLGAGDVANVTPVLGDRLRQKGGVRDSA